jgi:predicted hydrocarbon binding protein
MTHGVLMMIDDTKLTLQVLNLMFTADSCEYDLVGGKVTATTERVIYLSSDLIIGIYEALNYEAGEAWALIFNNCGYLWGRREIDRLKKELKIRIQQEIEQLSVKDFSSLIEGYFSKQGWGKVKIHLDDAEQYGIIRVNLKNGLFDANLSPLVNGSTNYMIAGLLRAFFENISQASLGCVETSWQRNGDQHSCDLLISGSARITALQAQLTPSKSVDVEDALGRLRVL